MVIIDAREWQNQFDLETGARTEKTHGLAPMVKKILADHPYPGDTDPLANTWVTQTAMDLIQNYDPSLVCLSYVQQFFTIRHLDLSFQNIHDLLSAAMDEALSFIKDSGYTPIIVGTGPMIPLSGVMDLSGLKGLAIASKWSCRYCGIHDPGPGDLDFLKGLNGMERLVTRDQWISMFKKSQPDLDLPTDIHLMPEVLAVAKEGFAFKTMGSTLRPPKYIPANNFTIPVSTPLGPVRDLREIKPLILGQNPGSKIALILLEGLGPEFFPENYSACCNGEGWFCNEPGDSFYLTLSTGKHQPFAYPAGYRYFNHDADQIKFPFSGYLTSVPDHTLAQNLDGRSIAVGNRSMFMHMAFGADIGVECFARNLFNQGSMAVINRSCQE
ncbi:MAG: hypothetical protein HUK40_08130 [Desulfobacter sp.]|nr:hypothetical protein [Desulfobacter sp.]